jgi:hypothetical protein
MRCVIRPDRGPDRAPNRSGRRATPTAGRDHGPVEEGFVIRELPDGGSEFVLDQPSVSCIRVDDQSTVQFGDTELVIGAPFHLEIDGVLHHLDPHHSTQLGPLLGLYPSTAKWVWTSAGGDLTAVFENGAALTVSPDPTLRAWSLGNVYCLPAGPT